MLRGLNARALAGVRDHVRIREDVALRGDDEARSLRLRGRGGGRIAEVGENRHDPGRPLARRSAAGRNPCPAEGRPSRWPRPAGPPAATPGRSRRPSSCPGRASPSPFPMPNAAPPPRAAAATVATARAGSRIRLTVATVLRGCSFSRENGSACEERQHEGETRAASAGVELHRAAHQLRQLLGDRKPEAAAGRHRSLEAIEAVEDLARVLGGNAPGPRPRPSAGPSRPGAPRPEPHRRAGRRVDERVLDEDPPDLQRPLLVAERPRRPGCAAQPESW